MNKQLRLILILLITVGCLSSCVTQWRSQYLFNQYCNEEGRIGQFIYERVGLGPEFFREIPTDPVELRGLEERFYLEDKTLLIDEKVLEQHYLIPPRKKITLSKIGPIDSFENTISRKSDGKLLSKAVYLSNLKARTIGIASPTPDTCPSGRDENGDPLVSKAHYTLIEKTFYAKKQLKD